MFDEKYMESHDKPIDSIEDAMMILLTERNCSGVDCDECAIRMYAKSGDCGVVVNKAREFLDIRENPLEAQEKIYGALLGGTKKLRRSPPQKSPRERPTLVRANTCAGCLHSKMHSSGILFCESFHNFVHEGGFCYRHEHGNME